MQLAHAAKDNHEVRAMPWALLTMLLDASCPADTKASEVRNAQFKAQNLASSDPDTESALQAAPFLELEVLLLDLHLGSLALKTHSFAEQQSNSKKYKLQLSLCKAQATSLVGDASMAVNILKTTVRGTGTRLLVCSDEICSHALKYVGTFISQCIACSVSVTACTSTYLCHLSHNST